MYKFTIEVENVPVLVDAFEKRFPTSTKLGPSSNNMLIRFSLEGDGIPNPHDLKPYKANVEKVFAWQEVDASKVPVAESNVYSYVNKAANPKAPKTRAEGARGPGRPPKEETLAKRAQEAARRSAALLEYEQAQRLTQFLTEAGGKVLI